MKDRLKALARTPWVKEISYIAAFYFIYSFIRNFFGSGNVSPSTALDNAIEIIELEQAFGTFFEERLQEIFLDVDWFLRFWNVFYGSFHFAVTGGVMIWLFLTNRERYRKYRTVLASTTALALIGFATYPLMPPRLLSQGGEFGGNYLEFTFVDTLAEVGGLWSFSSGGMEKISNQFAAMPSLHIAWALWCVFAAYPLVRSRWRRAALAIYPLTTLFAVVVTANHYWIDALGGIAILIVGHQIARLVLRVLPDPIASIPESPDPVPVS